MIGWMVMSSFVALAAPTDEAPAEAPDQALPETVQAPAGPDRSAPPPVEPPVPLDLSEGETWEVRPGVVAHVISVPGVRKVHGGVWLQRGSLDLDGGPTPATWLTGWLQDVATESHSSDDLEILQDLTDTSVMSDTVGLTRASVTLETPRENLDEGLDLLFEVLATPKYPGKDVRQTRELQHFWYVVEAPSNLQVVASELMDNGWYPADSPWGARPDLDALLAVRPKDLRERHARLLAEAPITVMLVGDLSRADVETRLSEAFADLGAAGEPTPWPPFEATPGTRVLAAHMPGQEQAVVMSRTTAPARPDADRVGFQIVNWALGGHFMSRLNANLREEKGFTYGAGSSYRIRDTHGAWTSYVTVKAENVGATVTEIQSEVERVRAEGITPTEIDAAWKEWVGEWNTVRQTGGTAFDFYSDLFEDGESLSEARADLDAIAALTPEATQEIAARWLDTESPWLWVIVGDRDKIGPQLEALGLQVEWVTPQQAVLGAL